ncbi:MAG: glycosyltransferase family 39 protein [Actinobacteria bacterium]|nr:glycosyltransferase family 39 protein [Actinomycetota bacterium]
MSKKYLLVIFIIVFTFAIRFLFLDKSPSPSLYGDELTEVYDSYSILKTGYSQTGDFLPWTFKMAEGRPPGYVYFSIPFVAIFGPNMFGARLLSVFSGLGIIILMFYLGKLLIDKRVGLIASFAIIISPWAINLSRAGFETNFALFLTLSGVVAFLKSKRQLRWLILSAICFAGAIHTYPTYKLTVPLLVLILILNIKAYLWLKDKKTSIASIIFIVIVSAAIGMVGAQAFLFGSEGRILSINVFNQEALKEQITQRINYELNLDQNPSFIKKLLHNKPLEYSYIIGENYLQSFSPDFLFLHGDSNPRHNPATMGEMYLAEALTILFGLLYLLKTGNKNLFLIIPWLLIAPIPAAIIAQPHALRNSLMLPPLLLLSATGFVFIWDFLKEKRLIWLKAVLILSIFFQFIIFTDRYFFVAPFEFSRFWSYPAKFASEMAIKEKNNYDYVILADSLNDIEFAYPVYAKVDPNLVIAQNKQRVSLQQYQFKKFGNVYIGDIPSENIEKYISSLPGSVFYIGTIEEEKSLTSYETIKGLDNLPAFVVKKKPF